MLLACRLVFPAHQVRPHRAHESDALAVRKPFRHRSAGGQVGDAACFTAIRRDHVELVFSVVAATVTFDDSTHTATLTPSSPLEYGKTYTVTVKSRDAGATDIAGNRIPADIA